MLGSRHLSPIGLDIGRHAIKAAQCTRSADPRLAAGVTLARVDEAPLPGVQECRRLAEILWRHGFQGRRAIVAVPESSLLASVVEVPPAGSGAPVRAIASAELARLHGADPAELETDSWALPPCGPKGQRHEAVAVGVKRGEVLALLDALESPEGGGFEVLAADVPPCARVRTASLADVPDGAWAILDVGWSATRLSVVDGGLIVYERALPDSGMAHLELRLEQECALKPDDIAHVLGKAPGAPARRVSGAWQAAIGAYGTQLAAEVKDSLRYLSLNRGLEIPRRVWLTGGGGACGPVSAQLAQSIEGATPVAIERLVRDAQASSSGSPSTPAPFHGPELAAAVGLALRAA